MGDAGCVRGQEKEWMGCFLDELRAVGINADQCGRLQPRTRGDSAERRKKGRNISWRMDRCRESQDWTTACNRMPERDGKDQE